MSEYFLAQYMEEMLKLAMRAKHFKYAQLKDLGLDELMRLAVATEGFGHLGERAPLDEKNVAGLAKMRALFWLWAAKKVARLMKQGLSEEEAWRVVRRKYAPALALIRMDESVTYARSQTMQTVVAPLSDILARAALKLKKKHLLEVEAVGAGTTPASSEAEGTGEK